MPRRDRLEVIARERLKVVARDRQVVARDRKEVVARDRLKEVAKDRLAFADQSMAHALRKVSSSVFKLFYCMYLKFQGQKMAIRYLLL